MITTPLPVPGDELAKVRAFVQENVSRGIQWSELVVVREDRFSFLEFSARCSDRRTAVLIEFGPRSGDDRKVDGVFEANWSRERDDFDGIQAVGLGGAPCALADFGEQMTQYLDMPVVGSEVSAWGP